MVQTPFYKRPKMAARTASCSERLTAIRLTMPAPATTGAKKE